MVTDIKNVLIGFGAGLGIGVLSGKIYYEKKYRMKLQGTKFQSDEKDLKPEEKSEEKPEEKPVETTEEKEAKESSEINKNKEDLSEMVKKAMEYPRVDYSTPTPEEKKHESEPKRDSDPSLEEDFEMEPDDFGERGEDDYEEVSVLYLADGHLVYENGKEFEPVEEPQRKIGKEAMRMLRSGEAPDVMYVRNKRLKIDYEIVLSDQTLNEGTSDEADEDEE